MMRDAAIGASCKDRSPRWIGFLEILEPVKARGPDGEIQIGALVQNSDAVAAELAEPGQFQIERCGYCAEIGALPQLIARPIEKDTAGANQYHTIWSRPGGWFKGGSGA